MTTTATLTERYVAAATRSVPEKNREDLRAELEASIVDAIEARVEAGEDQDAAERAVLTDMGDPDRLAADYTDRPSFLIGPRYYFEWLRLLKVLLWIVVPIAASGIALSEVLQGGDVGEVISAAILGAFTVALNIGFWVTLVFAILERDPGKSPLERNAMTKTGPWAAWTLERLPELRSSGLGRSDMIASLIFLGLAAGAIIWDRVVGLVWTGAGTDTATWSPVSVLNPDLWPWWISGLFLLMLAEAAMAIAIYVRGRWTWTFAAVNTALALLVGVPAILLLTSGGLINPALLTAFGVEGDAVSGVVTIIIAFVIAGIALWDVVDGVIKTVRGARR